MDLFKVYPLWDIDIVRAEGSYVWDDKGTRYLDMYGGHAVISIGHTHPHYVDTVVNQLKHIGFYSNSVIIDQQRELADKLGELSGKRDYQLFLCNSQRTRPVCDSLFRKRTACFQRSAALSDNERSGRTY